MEILGRIPEYIKNKFFKSGKKNQTDGWDYERFRNYLLGLTRGRNFLLPIDQYPNKIELSTGWHDLFNQMRRESARDHLERYALIGFKDDRRALYLPTLSVRGHHNQVTGEVITNEISRARTKAGITGLVGDIHSHPRIIFDSGSASFSPTDLYSVLLPRVHRFVIGVVEPHMVIFAFNTRETADLGVDPAFLNHESFTKFWIEKYGFVNNGDITKIESVSPRNLYSLWDINLGIAERHKLVFYRGVIDDDLIRAYPPTSKAHLN